MMFTAQQDDMGPFVIRYPRGLSVHPDWKNEMHPLAVGKGRCITEGEHVAILSIGHIGNEVAKAVEALAKDGKHVGHYDMRFVKPLDIELLTSVASSYDSIITVEDGCLQGGFGSAVLESMVEFCVPQSQKPSLASPCKVVRLGIPDCFVTHGSVPQLMSDCGFDAAAIVKAVNSLW